MASNVDCHSFFARSTRAKSSGETAWSSVIRSEGFTPVLLEAWSLRGLDREEDAERGPFSLLALHLDPPPVFLNDSVGNRKPQPGPPAPRPSS